MCDAGSSCVGDTLYSMTGAFAHICSMGLLVLGLDALLWRWIRPWLLSLIISVLALGYILPKELWYDYKYESAAERGTAGVDIATYIAGLILGSLLSLALPSPTPTYHYQPMRLQHPIHHHK